VHAEIVAVLADQLERRSNTKMGAGNHTSHRRWGYSCNMDSVYPYIHGCSNCTSTNQKLFQGLFSDDTIVDSMLIAANNVCTECSNWFLFEDSSLLLHKPDKDFPRSQLLNEQHIRPHKITFDVLDQAVKYVHDGILNKYLSKNEAISYLQHHCFNNDTVEQIYKCANNGFILNKVKVMHKKQEDHDNDYPKLLVDKAKHPHKYEIYQLPIFMYDNNISLDVFGDAPMHCLFLGISKTIYIDIQHW
jgi:hypothetical protein